MKELIRSDHSISIKKAAMIMAAAKYSNVIFMLLANAVLARILSAEDYGILAVITVFTTFFNIFSDMGLGAGVIQNKSLTKEDVDNIFSCTIFMGIGLTFIFFMLSFSISAVYRDSVYIPVGSLLSISVLFNTLNMIPNAVLMKDKKFTLVGIRTVVVYLTSYIAAILLALIGWRYYALVVQSIAAAVATFIWNYSSTRLGFRLHFQFSSVKKVLSFSSFNFAYDIANYFGRNLDNLLTGKFIGNTALGYYNQAYSLMLYPVNYLTNVITPVLHPILSDHQDDKKYIYDQYLKILKCLSLIGVFATVYCAFAAKEIVLILYGENWLEAIPCATVLSISIWFQMTTSTCTSIFKSLGESKIRFRSGLVYVAVQIIMISVGVVSYNLIVLSRFVAVSFIIRFFIEYYFLIKKAFGYSVISFYRELIPELIVAAIMCAGMFLSKTITVDNVLLSAIYKGLVCGFTYVFGMIITKQYKYLLIILPEKLRSKLSTV